MQDSNQIIKYNGSISPNPTLQIDYSWSKSKALITDKNDANAKPVYIVDCKLKKPNFIFKYAADESTFGTGSLHTIAINAETVVHGKPITLQALKRFKTSYQHLSYAYSDTDTPVPMTWTSDTDFKTWDFICLDPQQNPVAKFSANVWALKKVGNIEFLGDKASSSQAQDEIVVMGMTLFMCMAYRANNFLSLFGAIFARPGKQVNGASISSSESTAVNSTSEGFASTNKNQVEIHTN